MTRLVIICSFFRLTPLRTRFCNPLETDQQNTQILKGVGPSFSRTAQIMCTIFIQYVVINVYAPASTRVAKCAGAIDEFYLSVSTTYSSLTSSTMVFIVGDWNAQAGTRKYGERCIRSHGRGCRNMTG